LVLLFRAAKRSPLVLGTVAIIILAGRWIDLYLMIGPSQGDAIARPGLIEGGLLLGAGGLFVLICLQSLGRALPIPKNEPIGVYS
jgi:hypothetical protein